MIRATLALAMVVALETFAGGIAEHRANTVGLVREAVSEINANPVDTKDHAVGVWSVPPTLRQGGKDRDNYVAIGESDRMALRFGKPADAIQ